MVADTFWVYDSSQINVPIIRRKKKGGFVGYWRIITEVLQKL